jgi:hypothetical protein
MCRREAQMMIKRYANDKYINNLGRKQCVKRSPYNPKRRCKDNIKQFLRKVIAIWLIQLLDNGCQRTGVAVYAFLTEASVQPLTQNSAD